jgi:hypothetical protein
MATRATRATGKRATGKRAKKKQSARGGSKRRSASRSTKKKATKKKSSRKTAAKRTLIAPRGDKRYVRRTKQGRFKESDDVSRSLSSDRRKKAKRKAPRGQGDRGDR